MDAFKVMPQYDQYKDSCEDWIGDIPSHWELVPIRSIFKFRNEKNDPIKTEDILSLSIASGVTQYSEEGRGGNKRKDDLSAYKIAHPKDIVLNSMNVIVGAVGMSKYYGAISPVYYALYTENEDTYVEYYEKIFLNESFQRGLLKFGRGILIKLSGTGKLNTIRMKVSTDDLKTLYFPKPPLDEQKAIFSFLENKTSQIDEAIAIKEQQITLLKERKQIIIQQAITQGLNPKVPMKDSGVDWIGQIPEHWKIKRAKYLFNEIDERSKTGSEELLSVSHMTGVTPRSEKNVSMFMAEDYSGSKLCKENDLVMNIMWAWMGALGVSSQTGIVSPSYGVFRQKIANTFNPIYLEYLLKTTKYIEHYNKVSTGLHSSRLRFYSHMFFNMKIGFPSYEEQHEIVDYLTKQTEKIDSALSVQQVQIEKLKEYKSTLINSAVTGKIKVANN